MSAIRRSILTGKHVAGITTKFKVKSGLQKLTPAPETPNPQPRARRVREEIAELLEPSEKMATISLPRTVTLQLTCFCGIWEFQKPRKCNVNPLEKKTSIRV